MAWSRFNTRHLFGLTQRRLVAYKNRLACDGAFVPGRAFGN
ncbi:hypothetical protein X772_22740 [Mesorhizobium sp. LSJC280B00]|nr:hypothetical protein X772_22740 [Mesorhizobium sp. LSJC280B00]